MTENTRQHPGKERPTCTDDVAAQPRPPGTSCEPLPTSTPPELAAPAAIGPDESCNCPSGMASTASPTCLEDLIAAQAAEIAAADKAKAFKSDLEALLTKAKAARQEYTPDKYARLRRQWSDQDAQIAELLRKLECAVPCWRCVLECHVRPLLAQMHDAEQRLYGGGSLYGEVHNLFDLQYWHTRDRDAKDRRFQRIKTVLAAWENPAKTIEKALADDAKLIADAGKALGTDASSILCDVFLRLVPMHLAIAPPAEDAATTTKIEKAHTQFCTWDAGTPDDCCGPDVGEWSLRQRLIGPQPYLVDPQKYLAIICCLVVNRYGPAKDALAEAEAALAAVNNQIKRYQGVVDDGLKEFDKNARSAIPAAIDCTTYASAATPQTVARAR